MLSRGWIVRGWIVRGWIVAESWSLVAVVDRFGFVVKRDFHGWLLPRLDHLVLLRSQVGSLRVRRALLVRFRVLASPIQLYFLQNKRHVYHRHMLYHTNGHIHPFNSLFSGTTWVSRYKKGKTNLDFTEARDSEWQWHQLGHMQVCTLLQTDNHASTPALCFLQAGCPSCRPTNCVKALKAVSQVP